MIKIITLLAIIGITSLSAFECIKTTFQNGKTDYSTVTFRESFDALTMKWGGKIYHFNRARDRKVNGVTVTEYLHADGEMLKIFNGVDTTFNLKLNSGNKIIFDHCK